MSDFDTQHSPSPNRPLEFRNEGVRLNIWLVLGLFSVIALIGLLMVGAGEAPVGGTVPVAFDSAPN